MIATESVELLPLASLVEDGKISYGVVQPGSDVPDGVPMVRVKDIRNGVIDTRDPLYVSREISDQHSRTILAGGEVLVTLVGTVGESAVVRDDLAGWNVARAVAVLRPTSIEPAWLKLCFELPATRSFIDGALNTTVQSTLNLADLKLLPVPLPPESFRAGVLAVMGALDDKIAANARIERSMEQYFAASFTRLVRDPETAVGNLFDFADIDFGEPFGGEHFCEPGDGRALIRIRDLKTHRCQVWTTEARRREIVVHRGDVLVGMDAEFRASTWLGDDGLLNQRVCRVSSSPLGPAFIIESLRQPLNDIENEKSGTTVIHLNKSDLEQIAIPVPSDKSLAAFRRSTDSMYLMRLSLAQERVMLAGLRDTLLPHLMSGKLRIKDAEKQVEAVV